MQLPVQRTPEIVAPDLVGYVAPAVLHVVRSDSHIGTTASVGCFPAIAVAALLIMCPAYNGSLPAAQPLPWRWPSRAQPERLNEIPFAPHQHYYEILTPYFPSTPPVPWCTQARAIAVDHPLHRRRRATAAQVCFPTTTPCRTANALSANVGAWIIFSLYCGELCSNVMGGSVKPLPRTRNLFKYRPTLPHCPTKDSLSI